MDVVIKSKLAGLILALSIIFFGLEDDDFIAKFFTFKTISVTSSLTPLIEENSCKTPSI